MPRKKKKPIHAKQPASPVKKPSPSQKTKEKKNSISRQLIALFVSFILISLLVNKVKGYQWLYNGLLLPNLELIDKYDHLTTEQKYTAKLGFNYTYLNYLIEHTPKDAIILMPPKEEIFPKDKKTKFENKNPHLVARKTVSSYFLYPRKLVYEREKNTNELYSKATHVAIVNFWGYDKLNYQVSNKVDNTVLPINRTLK